ncbi:MAG: GAF domain-containing protein [Candidatus Sericytochromatia bacterium]|nr:GAF domain-containing protein [Candidatus Tanganyikabacteria bacterium]
MADSVEIPERAHVGDPHRRALRRLVAVVKDLSMARDAEAIQQIVKVAARDLVGADGAAFVLRDGDLCYYVEEDAIGPLWKGRRFPMAACISGWAMHHKEAVAIQDIFADARIPVDAYAPTFVRSLVMVPIRVDDPVGAIGTYWAGHHEATPDEIDLLQSLADSTSVALENVGILADLERRVEERTRRLQDVNRDLEAFAASVSHDLKNPLNTMVGFASILDDSIGEQIDPADRQFLQRIQNGALRMRNLIDDYLDLARAAAASLQIREVDLSATARGIVEDLATRDAGRSVTVTVADGLSASGDPELIASVLSNLLANAWKFTSKCDSPRIEVGEIEEGERHAYYVRDNGAGFDPEGIDRLFQPFERLHTQSEFPGTGVGLASAKRIVERHGGRIWAETGPAGGATFYFTLGE